MNPIKKIETISYKENEISIENGNLDQESVLKIKAFLKRKKESAVNFIAVISQDEIVALKDALLKEPNGLNEFLESQEKETITSNEIMKGSNIEQNLGGAEKLRVYLDMGDQASYKYFFEGENAIFKGLNISEDAKRNFSVGANFFIINYLNKKFEDANLSGDIGKIATELLGTGTDKGLLENLPEMLGKGEGLVKSLNSKWKFISEISFSDIGKTFNSFFGSDKLKILSETMKELELEGKGENNGVFINPLESHNFMKFVFESKNLTKEQIKGYIESKQGSNINFEESERQELSKIGDKLSTFITPEMGNILGKGLEIKQFYKKSKDTIKESILGNKTAISILGFLKDIPWIGELITMFLGFLGIDNINDLLSGKNFEVSKKTIQKNILKEGSLFQGKKIPDTFMKINSGGNDTEFLDNINYVIGKKEGSEFGKEIEKLFKKDGDYIKFYNGVKQDLQLGDLINGDIVNYIELKKSIKLYKNYKIELKNNPNTTVVTFIEKTKKQENQTQLKQEGIDSLLKSKKTKIELIKTEDKFEILDNEIEYVFENSGVKYKVNLFDSGELVINGGGKIVKFNGAENIFQGIVKFKGRLNDKANSGDFGESFMGYTPELNGNNIGNIIVNGLHEKVLGKQVDKDGLNENIVNNFIGDNGLKNENINLVFNGQEIKLAKISSNGFENNDVESEGTILQEPDQSNIENSELEDGRLRIENGKDKYSILYSGINENGLIVTINSHKYKLNETNNLDWTTNYPKFNIQEKNGKYILLSAGIEIEIENLITGLKKEQKYILKKGLLQDLILEKIN